MDTSRISTSMRSLKDRAERETSHVSTTGRGGRVRDFEGLLPLLGELLL